MNMHLQAGDNDPVWFKAVPNLKSGRPLTSDQHVDVCIVGAGIAGVSCAYHLAREGRKVAVVDFGSIGGGQTCMTTAHLSNQIDDGYVYIEKTHGVEGARACAESHTAAIKSIERIAHNENIDCDFRYLGGYLFSTRDPKELDAELAAARRAGLGDVEKWSQWPVPAPNGPTASPIPCLRFPQQAQFHPLKYLVGLADVCEKKYGVQFYEARVKDVHGGKHAHIETDDGRKIHAGAVIVATNSPVNDMFVIHTKQSAYTTYVVGIEVARNAVPTGLYWDTASPYHYVRLEEGDAIDSMTDVLIVGGEDHKTGQANNGEERYAHLEAWARDLFPGLGPVKVRWCGQVMEPVDGVAYIGRNPLDDDNVYIVTGDSGMGITHGAMSGLILTDLIMGRENLWEKLYDPSRKTLSSLWKFAAENLNVAVQYADWLQPSQVKSTSDIQPGSGAVIRNGTQLIAAYRDDHGELHECSAKCPHLGGVVAWNQSSGTWDCPCHGSRFDPTGRVLEGPAISDLQTVSPTVVK